MTQLTLPAILDVNVAIRPDAPAAIEGQRRVTFAELDSLSRRTAAWLAEQGIRRGDRVAIWLPNRVEWLALFFGLARLDATCVAVNTRYRAAELEYILERSWARMLVLQPDFGKIDFRGVLRDVRAAGLSRLETVTVVGLSDSATSPILARRTIALPELASGAPAVAAVVGTGDPEAVAALFTTSGTTKAPKLVTHVQRTIAFHTWRIAEAHALDQPGARLLAALPFCGVFGLNSALAALAGGAPVVLMQSFDPNEATALIRAHGVTHMYGSDDLFRRLFDVAPGDEPFPSARLFGFGAFNPGGIEMARAAVGRRVPMVGLYGSSEVQALFAVQPQSLPPELRTEGGGRPAATRYGAEVRVRDSDTGELLPPGVSGDLEIRAPGNFVGYLDDPASTSEAILPDGFFRTGDVGRLRDDGTFVFEARRGDAMRLGGFLVSPFEIEEFLKGIPGIVEAGVVAVEIEGAMRCVAFVVPATGATVREQEVIEAAAARMARFKVPARVWTLAALPVTDGPNGVKVQRGRLREMALAQVSATGRPSCAASS